MDNSATMFAVLNVVDCFYPKVPVAPTDPGLAALLHRCSALGISTFGLTARRPGLAAQTWTQMGERCNFAFALQDHMYRRRAFVAAGVEEAMRDKAHVWDPAKWEGLLLERGVWFTANANKGSLLQKVLPAGMHVVFADDSRRHLVDANAALDGHAASVTGLHFTAATSAAEQNLDSAECDKQMAMHLGSLFAEWDPMLLDLVARKDLFLKKFIQDQQLTAELTSDAELFKAVSSLAAALGFSKHSLYIDVE